MRLSTLWKDPFCGLPDTWFRQQNLTNIDGPYGREGTIIDELNPQLVHDKTVTWYGLILFSTATGMMGLYAIKQIITMCSTPPEEFTSANSITHKVGSLTF